MDAAIVEQQLGYLPDDVELRRAAAKTLKAFAPLRFELIWQSQRGACEQIGSRSRIPLLL